MTRESDNLHCNRENWFWIYLFRRRYSCPSDCKEGVPGGGDAKVVPVDPGQPGSEV